MSPIFQWPFKYYLAIPWSIPLESISTIVHQHIHQSIRYLILSRVLLSHEISIVHLVHPSLTQNSLRLQWGVSLTAARRPLAEKTSMSSRAPRSWSKRVLSPKDMGKTAPQIFGRQKPQIFERHGKNIKTDCSKQKLPQIFGRKRSSDANFRGQFQGPRLHRIGEKPPAPADFVWRIRVLSDPRDRLDRLRPQRGGPWWDENPSVSLKKKVVTPMTQIFCQPFYGLGAIMAVYRITS